MRDVDAQATQYKNSVNPLSSEAVKLAYSQAAALKDVQVFSSGEHTVTSGKVIARGNAIVHAMNDDVTVFALDHAVVDSHSATVAAYGHAHVHAEGNGEVFAHEKSVIEADGQRVFAYDKASVTANNSAVYDVHRQGRSDVQNLHLSGTSKLHDVLLFTSGEHWLHSGEAQSHGDGTIVHVDGTGKLNAYDQSTGLATGTGEVEAWDHARIVARDHATAVGFSNVQIDAADESDIFAHDSSVVQARGHATVGGNDGCQVFAYDNVDVQARDSMANNAGHIEAFGHSTITRNRFFPGPPHISYNLHDQTQFFDTDTDGKVTSTVHAGDK